MMFLSAFLCILHVLHHLSVTSGVPEEEGCTRGFTSVERMGAVLGGYGKDNLIEMFKKQSVQIVVPRTTFTCSGRIEAWVFGAQWRGGLELFTELQIWRPASGEEGLYTKVGSTTIVTVQQPLLYRYPLSSPLDFQAGDVLGFYQGRDSLTQLRLLYESTSSGPQTYHSEQGGPQTTLRLNETLVSTDYHVLIGIETDVKGCDSGFMSVERMRILLGLDAVQSPVRRGQRQQITPHINFTCEGFITRWVVGAEWSSDDFQYPELQIWRREERDSSTYRKVHGTFLRVGNQNSSGIYEYSDFSPIPFQPGDIVGIFQPRNQLSKLRVLSEDTSRHVNYYLPVENSDTESPFEEIDFEETEDLESQQYLPLVSVYVTDSIRTTPTHRSSDGSTSLSRILVPTPQEPTDNSATEDSGSNSVTEGNDSNKNGVILMSSLIAGLAVSATITIVLLLIAVGLACRGRKRKRRKNSTEMEQTISAGSSQQGSGGGAASPTTVQVLSVQGYSGNDSSGEYRKFDNPLYTRPHHVYESI